MATGRAGVHPRRIEIIQCHIANRIAEVGNVAGEVGASIMYDSLRLAMPHKPDADRIVLLHHRTVATRRLVAARKVGGVRYETRSWGRTL